MSKMVMTNAGIAEVVNAEKTGTAPVKLSHVAFGTGQYTATADRTALKAEIKRFAAVSGGGVGDNKISVSITDDSTDAYTVYEVGVFTESGTLFAVYSQTTPLVSKAASSVAMLAVDVVLGEMNPASVTVGDTNFVLNPATTEREGVIELATEAEAKAGADAQRAITPATLDKVIEGHDNIVHRSGYEIIEGQKTFANNPSITNTYPFFTIQQSDIVRGATPATTQDSGVAFVDSKLTRIGLLQSTYTDSGDIKMALYAYKPQPKEDGEFICDALTLVYPASGTPYVTIPEPPPKDNSNKIATTAWVTTKAKEYLPLAGGTMSGAITLDGTASVFAADRDLWFAHSTGNNSYRACVLAGDAYNTGASLYMHGKDYASNPGQFCLQAHDGTKLSALVGNPDGTLVWKNIVLASGYIKKNDKTSGLNICSGQAYNDSPAISLYPSDYSDANMAGRFVLRSGENEYQLTGKSDGTLQWNGTALSLSGTIQTSVNQALVKTDTKGGIQVCGGTNLEDGGSILGYGMNYELNPEFKGALRLQAMDGTNKYDVVLFPKGRFRLGNGTRMNFQDNEDQHIFIDGNGDLLLGDTDGAFIRVCGQESSINPSGFQFRAKSESGDPIYLIGKPDGTLTWGGKNVLTEDKDSGMHIGMMFPYPGAVPPEGAYLLNGQTITNCKTLYPEFWNWVNNSGVRKITSSVYDSELSATGVCGGFVIDSAAGSVRLPTLINGTLWGADSATIGQSLAAGLPNITGTFSAGARSNPTPASGSFAVVKTGDPNTGEKICADGATRQSINFDASRSSSVYGKSDTVQPPAIKVSWCIQVFNAATELSEQQSAQLASQMQMKAQTDLANTGTLADSFMAKLMPDYSSGVAISHPTSSVPFTAPCSGYFMECFYYGDEKISQLLVNGVVTGVVVKTGASYRDNRVSVTVPLSKGDVIYWDTEATTIYGIGAVFYPVKGV